MILIEQADELLLPEHDHDALEELPGGRMRLHLVDRLKGVTPEMIEWWFGNMEHDTYMQWHPRDHQEFAWVAGWEPGRYVGATHMTKQTFGGVGTAMRANITFAPRALWFDWKRFAEFEVGVVICAIVHMHDDRGEPKPEEAARFVHIGLRRDYGTEFRSSFWVNPIPDMDMDRATTARSRHVHEECEFLSGFLPDLYREHNLAAA